MITYMQVADVLLLPSIEYGWVENGDEIISTGDYIEDVDLDNHHLKIKEQMRADGINAVPIHVARVQQIAEDYYDNDFAMVPSALAMGNGHHRLKMAVELGHEWIRTSDDIMDTGMADDPVMGYNEADDEVCTMQWHS